MRAVRAFDAGDDRGFVKLNEVYITLLPKCDRAVDVKDHRPVSMVHSFAKILAKVMSLQLAPSLPKLIGPNQSAFIGGRAISDNFMLVQQSIRSLHRRRVDAVMLKLDMAKAFDSISWPFLLEVL